MKDELKRTFAQYRSQELHLTPTLLRQITKNTYIGLGWDYANLQAAAPDDEFKAYMSKRHFAITLYQFRIKCALYLRQSRFLPNARQGQAFDISYTHYSSDTGSNNRFNATQMQYNYYYPLTEDAVLAFDSYARFYLRRCTMDATV